MRLHHHVAGLCALADPRWRAKLWRLGLWLLVPGAGWPAVLGYRARFARSLVGSAQSVLPEVDGTFGASAREGLRGMAVIFGYLSPLYLTLTVLVLHRGYLPGTFAFVLLAVYVLAPIVSTLSFPIACLLLALGGQPYLSGFECALFVSGYAILIFFVPAGFLQVSRTGRYRSAFALWRTVPFVFSHLAEYVEAWTSAE